jgi:hypothetical protein
MATNSLAGDSHLYRSRLRARLINIKLSIKINNLKLKSENLKTAFCMIAAWVVVQFAVWSALHLPQADAR